MLEEYGFAVERFQGWQNLVSAPHGHDVLEINYLVEGRAIQTAGDLNSNFEKGMLTVINYGLTHSIITAYGGIDIINVYIDVERFALPRLDEALMGVLRCIIPLSRFSINNLNKAIGLKADCTREFEAILFAMLHECSSCQFAHSLLIKEYFRIFLIYLCRFAANNGLSRAGGGIHGFEKIESLLGYLEENCGKHIELERLADYAGLSKHYLCRKFKQTTGQTIFRYLLSRRIERAMYELRTTDKKIIDIALDCGFENISNFNRQFKVIVSKTPSRYRQTFLQPRR